MIWTMYVWLCIYKYIHAYIYSIYIYVRRHSDDDDDEDDEDDEDGGSDVVVMNSDLLKPSRRSFIRWRMFWSWEWNDVGPNFGYNMTDIIIPPLFVYINVYHHVFLPAWMNCFLLIVHIPEKNVVDLSFWGAIGCLYYPLINWHNYWTLPFIVDLFIRYGDVP